MQLEYGTAKSSRKCVQDASGQPSDEAQQRYLFALRQLHQLLGEKAEAAAAAQAALEPEQRQLAAAAADAQARRDALLLFIRDVAAASAKAASEGQIKAAVPAAAVQHFISSEPGKAAEVRALRAAHSRLVHRVAAAERRLKAADHLSAEGLHLVDYEQLRIENAGLAAKREARLAEAEKLRGRLAQAVQVRTQRPQGLVPRQRLRLLEHRLHGEAGCTVYTYGDAMAACCTATRLFHCPLSRCSLVAWCPARRSLHMCRRSCISWRSSGAC